MTMSNPCLVFMTKSDGQADIYKYDAKLADSVVWDVAGRMVHWDIKGAWYFINEEASLKQIHDLHSLIKDEWDLVVIDLDLMV